MGDIFAVLSITLALIVLYVSMEYKLSKIRTRIRMLDDVYVGKENAAAAIAVLEGLIRNLNALCKDHQKRLDILEADHPDDEIDYGTVDDDGNITEVWFNGKRYVPEDKRDEDAIKIYADNKVMAETTRPEEKRCCATCRHYRPGPDHTCTIRPWLRVTSNGATIADSACNNYEKLVLYKTYKGIISDDKTEELQKRIADLNYFYNVSLMSEATYMHRWEELIQNDT